ncbi:MAG TPA: hypothetical protein VHL11_03810, partial [Phototrophicaceae bacterium]|nr:hypothetical protein [Phototrophicaceae bacterium]
FKIDDYLFKRGLRLMQPMTLHLSKNSFNLVVLLLLTIIAGSTVAAQDAPGYTVTIDPANFVTVVDNPYFPRIPGTKWVYEGQTADGLEHNELEILTDTREIMGVTTTVIHDVVNLDGVLIEDTLDFFAQDQDGNVWYFGEEVSNYRDGQLVDSEGSWEAGVDGALPGIVMYGDVAAHIGETYRQEYYAGEAEDMGILLNNDGIVTVPYNDSEFQDVVMTYDFTPLETDSHELKYFAAGIGEVKSIDLVTRDEDVLIDFTAP